MPRHVAFLRAINVGGRNVKMARLRELFGFLGFTSVETFIASGNVIFDPDKDAGTLEPRIEEHLLGSLGYEVATFVRTPSEMADISRYCPFNSGDLDAGGASLYIAFLHAQPSAEAERKLMTYRTEVDDLRIREREVYWMCRAKMSDSPFSGTILERVLEKPATMRDATTVRRLAAKFAAPR